MSFQVSQPGLRMVYNAAKQEMMAAGISADRAVLTQSELRSEIILNTNTTSYQIPLLINQQPYGNIAPTERRLNLQDSFFTSSIGVFLGFQSSATDFAYPLFTYPSLENYGVTAIVTPAIQRDLNALYNGYISYTVDQRVLIPYWDMWKHYKVNQTQGAVGVTAQTIFPLDQADLTTDGHYPVEPNVVHIGSTNAVMTLNLPQAIAALPASPVITRLIVIQRGLLAQNVTSVTNA